MALQNRLLATFVALAIALQVPVAMDPAGADLSDPSALASHACIRIDGDAQFNSSNGVVRGSGTPADPYVIENWSISAASAIGIYIGNVRAPFIVRNCEIANGSSGSGSNAGLEIHNASDYVVADLNIHDCPKAFGLSYSTNATMYNCTIHSGRRTNYGWYLENFTFVQNSIYDFDKASACGLEIRYSANVAIIRNSIRNTAGVYMNWNWGRIDLLDNDISDCAHGIDYHLTPGGTVQNNSIADCTNGFCLDAYTADYQKFNISPNNTVNGRPVRYLVGESDLAVPTDCGWLGLVNCQNITAEDISPEANCSAITVVNTSRSRLDNLTLEEQSLLLLASNNNTVSNCTVEGGISVKDSQNETVRDNRLSVGMVAIENSVDVRATNNTIERPSTNGMYCSGERCTLDNNTVKQSGYDGISVTGADIAVLYNGIEASTDYGIVFGNTSGLRIGNCTITGCGLAGIATKHELEARSNEGLAISGCLLHNNSVRGDFFGGVSVANAKSGRVHNNTLRDLNDALYMKGDCGGLQVDGNSFYNCSETIVLESRGVRIHNNTIQNGRYGVRQQTITDADNTIENNTIAHMETYGIYVTAPNHTIRGNTIHDGKSYGIIADYNANGNISHNTVYNYDWTGIYDRSRLGQPHAVFNNTVHSCGRAGIEISYDGHKVQNNTAYGCRWAGIRLVSGGSQEVTGNTLHSNQDGIYLEESNDNIISGNYITNSTGFGINFYTGTKRSLVYNNYFNNSFNYNPKGTGLTAWNVSKRAGPNILGGRNLGGNYWSNYTGWDLDDDGLGDTDVPCGPGDWLPAVGDLMPPAMTDQTQGVPTTGDLFVLNARVRDNRAVDAVLLEYWGEGTGSGTANSTFTSGTAKDGNYAVNLSIGPGGTKLSYRWMANDTSNNQNRTVVHNLTIRDNDPPEADDLTGEPVTNTILAIRLEVQDNIGIDEVVIDCGFDDAVPTSMAIPSPGPYEHALLVPRGARKMAYSVTAYDLAGNRLALPKVTKPVRDDIFPTVIDRSGTPRAGEPYTIECDISDNVAVAEAAATYWFDSENGSSSRMTRSGTYKLQIGVPPGARTLHYRVEARDGSNNTKNISADRPVVDGMRPTIIDNTGSPTTGDELVLSFDVSDNWELAGASLEYRFDGQALVRLTCAGDVRVKVPADGRTLYYCVTAQDLSGNRAGLAVERNITDNDPPEITGTPPEPLLNRTYVPGLAFSDNIGVKWANLTYGIDAGARTTVQYAPGFMLNMPKRGELLHLSLSVADLSGNACGMNWTLSIRDPDIPQIEDGSGIPCTGQKFTIKLTVRGNREPFSIELSYRFDDSPPQTVNNQVRIDIRVPDHARTLHYAVRVSDADGKKNEASFTRPVKDVIPPTIRDLTEGPAYRNARMRFAAEIVENIQLTEVTLEYWTDDGPLQSVRMTGSGPRYGAEIALPDGHVLNYRISCSDNSGNNASTGDRIFPITERQPGNLLSTTGGPLPILLVGAIIAATVAGAILSRRNRKKAEPVPPAGPGKPG